MDIVRFAETVSNFLCMKLRSSRPYMLDAQRRMYVRIQAYGRESFRIHEFLGTVWFVTELFPSKEMENVSELFPSNRVDKTRYVTELFPSKEMENVPELFPSNRRYGESNGEMNGEIRRHSEVTTSKIVNGKLRGNVPL
jgi:hypothetical protein